MTQKLRDSLQKALSQYSVEKFSDYTKSVLRNPRSHDSSFDKLYKQYLMEVVVDFVRATDKRKQERAINRESIAFFLAYLGPLSKNAVASYPFNRVIRLMQDERKGHLFLELTYAKTERVLEILSVIYEETADDETIELSSIQKADIRDLQSFTSTLQNADRWCKKAEKKLIDHLVKDLLISQSNTNNPGKQ